MKTRIILTLKVVGIYLLFFWAFVIGLGIYFWLGSLLVSGIFHTDFTVWQFIQVNILGWLIRGVYKFFVGVRIEK